ncbi:hypothetical protein BGZ73_008794 [Actinomortierella ambigua]|nr:hypothetical protein BGZ73_008794 [Actinomortierella ambigua]
MSNLHDNHSGSSSSLELQLTAEKPNHRSPLAALEIDHGTLQNHLTEREKELKELEARINAVLDAKLQANLDRHPRAIYFILPNEFGERFCYYAVSPNVNKYFMQIAGVDRHAAKGYATSFVMFVYFFPLLGATISDSFLGKWWTIISFSVVYLIGMILLTVFSIPNLINAASTALTFMPLVIIALGTGGIKPCVSSHGGDQYLPTQEAAKDRFFSLFYATITLGSAASLYVVPALADMPCMGLKTCYPYAFLVPTIVFFIALILFVAGHRWYRIVPPMGECLPWKAFKATMLAWSRYRKATTEERAEKGHWLNFAAAEYGWVFVDECRDFGLSLWVVMLPCSFCKMLYVQNANEWATQYYQMNGALFGQQSKILAAQFSNFNMILVVIQMPLLSYCVYPLVERYFGWEFRLTRRLAVGYILIIAAFAISAFLSNPVEEAFRQSGRNPTRLADYDGTYCETCVSGWAQFPQWFLLSLGECMFIPTGMLFMYVESGRSFLAFAASVWLVEGSLGAFWVNLLDPVMVRGGLSTAARNWTYTAIGTAGCIVYMTLAWYYVPRKRRPAINHAAQEAKDAEYGRLRYGCVYHAVLNNQAVAAKSVHLSRNDLALDTIRKEISVMQRLRHRHIIQFYETLEHEGQTYLIMDLAERGNLSDAIERGDFTVGENSSSSSSSSEAELWATKTRIAHEIARGLEYIHHQGILHRDLKTANVLLTKHLEVRLCDFGLAHVKSVSTASTVGAFKGTIRWASPELMRVDPMYSTKSDIYALGMVLWALAANCREPFVDHIDNLLIMALVTSGEREVLPDDTPFEYREWVERCWRQDPAQRPAANEIVLLAPSSSEALQTTGAANDQGGDGENDDSLERRHKAMVKDVAKLSIAQGAPSDGGQDNDTGRGDHNGEEEEEGAAAAADGAQQDQEDKTDKQASVQITDEAMLELLDKANAGDAEAQYEVGQAYEDGREKAGITVDYRQAADWYHKAADQGHVRAQYCLGVMYRGGCDGVEKDDEASVSWIRKAVEQDDAEAKVLLGVMYEQGRGGLAKSDEEAVAWYRKAAEQGSAKAELYLGMAYEHGQFVEKDLVEAARWYRKSADHGFPAGCRCMGVMYRHGHGVDQDLVEAARWFRLAADHGDDCGQLFLGIMYEQGKGIEKSDEEAVAWYLKSAAKNNNRAMLYVGLAYEHGQAVEKNPVEAVKWYRKAAMRGYAAAQKYLGFMYEQGQGVTKSYETAVEWYRRSAEQGFAEAQACLGVMYESGRGVEQDFDQAMAWYRKAADKGHSIGTLYVGLMYERGHGVETNYDEAVAWYRKAAAMGNSRAELYLGLAYEHGNGVEQSYVDAVEWYRKSAEQGNSNAQKCLGAMYEHGLGVTRNHTEAVVWYRKGSEQGNPVAQRCLGIMYMNGSGVEQSDAEAMRWLHKAAAQGEADAQVCIGIMYEQGRGVEKSDTQAVTWFRKAAENGSSRAELYLGLAYEHGQGVPEDPVEAVAWYKKAASHDNVTGHRCLGVMYRSGSGVEQNFEEAVACFRKAGDMGDIEAQVFLGIMYERGHGVEKSDTEAVAWYRKAAAGGSAKAELYVGLAYEHGIGVERSFSEAFKWYRRSADRGNIPALKCLGAMYEEGRGVERDYSEAIKFYRMGAEQGNLVAEYCLGRMLYSGRGCETNYVEAAVWCLRSAQKGYAEAQFLVGFMYEHGHGVKQSDSLATSWYRKAIEQDHAEAMYSLAMMSDRF